MKIQFRLWFTALLLIVGVLVMIAGSSQPSGAAGPWYVAPGGNDANSCQAPAQPCATIDGAIAKASSGDTILVATGVYTSTGDQVVLLDKGAHLSGGWDSSFTMQAGAAIIDGQQSRRGIIINSDTIVTIEQFTILGGKGYGAGIFNRGTLTLSYSIISGNSGGAAGGGIHNEGTLDLNNSTVRNNGSDEFGGGISNSGTLILNNSTVCNNTSNRGGGIHSQNTLTLNNSAIRDNSAAGPDGLGGGIHNAYGSVILNSSSVSGNKGKQGGGIFNHDGTVIMNNSTASGNAALVSGAGIYNRWKTLALYSSTISGNAAGDHGGGIENVSPGGVTLQNSIIAGNTGGAIGPDCYADAGTLTSAGTNLIGNTSGCSFSASTGDLTDVDPDLGSWEGSPAYHPLLPGSPAVNGGNPAGCNDDKGNPLPTDQRGFARFGRCDIGAYELQPIGFSTLTANRSVALPGAPLIYTLTLRNPGATELPNVRVTDTLPVSLDYIDHSLIASSGSSGYQSSVITWTGTVNAGGPVTITYGATVDPGASLNTTITNSAVVSGGGEIVTRTALVYISPANVYVPLLGRSWYAPFRDNFGNPASGWPIGDDGRIRLEYLSGEYRMLVRPPDSWAGARPGAKCSDHTLAVDVRNPSGVDGTYGLIFGLSDDWREFYTFEIGPDGYYYLWRYDDDYWTSLVWGSSSSINTGTGTNRLKVERVGAQIKAYANNQLLVSISDATYTGVRHIGLIATSYDQANVDARFDNFVMCAPGCSAAASLTEAAVTSQNSLNPQPSWSADAASSGTTGPKTTAPSGLLPQPDAGPTQP